MESGNSRMANVGGACRCWLRRPSGKEHVRSGLGKLGIQRNPRRSVMGSVLVWLTISLRACSAEDDVFCLPTLLPLYVLYCLLFRLFLKAQIQLVLVINVSLIFVILAKQAKS